MSQRKVLFQRIVSPDGQSIAEARSEVIASDTNETVSPQSVTVKVSSTTTTRNSSSHSSSSLGRGAASG